MARNKKEYQKLPGLKKGFIIGKYTLWEGSDHLLHVFSRFGVEDYKRFYFSDIQAIITRKTAVGFFQNLVLGILLGVFLLSVIASEGGWSIFWGFVVAMMLILLVINLLRGPTCESHLMTAVQTEKLHSLGRLKNALKVINRLGPLIEQVQGRVTSENLDQMPIRKVEQNSVSIPGQPAGPAKRTVKHEKGRVHMILFGLLLVDGLLASVSFSFSHVFLTLLGSVVSICMGIFVIIALVKQHNSDMRRSLCTLTWVTLGFVGISFATGYVFSMMYALKQPGIMYNQWEMLKSISEISPWESPLMLGINIFVICGALFLGCPGLFMLKRSRKPEKITNATRANSYNHTDTSTNHKPG
jgi:hypothetical protein